MAIKKTEIVSILTISPCVIGVILFQHQGKGDPDLARWLKTHEMVVKLTSVVLRSWNIFSAST